MEINTTIGEFEESMKNLNKPHDTPITVIIEEVQGDSEKVSNHKSRYPFLHSGFWEHGNCPTDLAEKHDKYLYDEI
ncbi:MAG: hypothetical protein HQM14_22065 [SAR324 cluster bacterium]|nr:hypothetical protein [SAR324 cluster bacterium]